MTLPFPPLTRTAERERRRQYAYAKQQGHLFLVKVKHSHEESPIPEMRGVIRGFTRPARMRLLKTIARINWRATGKCVFITLTYPDQFIDRGYKARTQDRYLFLRAIEKHLGRKVATLWRVEFKPRKSGSRKGSIAAHVHFLIFNCGFIDKTVVRKTWRSVLGHVGPLATRIDGLKVGKKAALYASKYAAKEADLGALDNASKLNIGGRAWGVTRPSMIPLAKERQLDQLDAEQLAKAMHIASQILGREYLGSFFVLGENALHYFCRVAGKSPKAIDG